MEKLSTKGKSDREVQDFIAQFYGKRYSGSGFLYHSKIVTEMLDGVRMSDRRSDKILDSGCGIGFISQLYPNFDITGIDLSEEMLKRNPFKWRKMDAEQMDFPDNSFDFVVCRSLLHHLDSPSKGLAEMYRVLKPGGTWVCWDPNYSFFSELFRAAARHTDRFSHVHKNFKAEEFKRLIENAGFKIKEIKFIGFLAYPLCGFPDIKDFKIPLGLAKSLIALDDFIGKTPLKRLAWSIMIKATKEA